VPLDPNDGPRPGGGDCVYLRVTLACTLEDLAEYEWVSDLVPDPDTGELCRPLRYREWLIPAEKINGLCVIDLLEEGDVE
jgi:hypothetical protein